MIKLFLTPMLGVLNQSSLSSFASLSRAESFENRARAIDLQHISGALARISATLDRRQLGIILEQGGGRSRKYLASDEITAPSLVTTSYPLNCLTKLLGLVREGQFTVGGRTDVLS
jgi:hypothetical protein